MEKYPHPLEGQLPHLYNAFTGKIAFRTKITNENDALVKMPIVKSFPTYKSSDELICNPGERGQQVGTGDDVV